MKISLIIPTINSEHFFSKSIKKITKIIKNFNYEIIIINDFSNDNTIKIIKERMRVNRNIKLINNKKREGQFNSLVKGISKSTGDFIITLDDDEEFNYSNIIKIIKYAKKKKFFDIIIGYSVNDNRNLLRKLGRFFINYNNSRKQIPHVITSSFRLMKKNFAKKILKYHNKKNEPFGPLIFKLTAKIENIFIKRSLNPLRSKSNYSTIQLLKLYILN